MNNYYLGDEIGLGTPKVIYLCAHGFLREPPSCLIHSVVVNFIESMKLNDNDLPIH